MAQNGNGFTVSNMKYIREIYTFPDRTIDWQSYYDSAQPKKQTEDENDTLYRRLLNIGLDFRAYPGNFDTEFMLQRYVNNMRELHNQGYALPEGITEAELDYMECLANRLEGAEYKCVRP